MGRQTAYEIRLQKAAAKRAAAKAEADAETRTHSAAIGKRTPARRSAAGGSMTGSTPRTGTATTEMDGKQPETKAARRIPPAQKGGRRTGPPSRPIAVGTTNLSADGEILFDPMLSIDQVAMWLQKPKSTLYKWSSLGEGPQAHKIGAGLRYRRSDVEAFIESCALPATDLRSA